MQATLYVNSDDRRRLNKTPVSPLNVDISFKEDTNILTPSFDLAYFDNFSKYNYVYIPLFNRYYFIKLPIANLGHLITFECEVDPLMSWKSYINELTGITSRSYINNILLADPKMKVLAKSNIVQHNFLNSELLKSISTSNYSIILNVIGEGVGE